MLSRRKKILVIVPGLMLAGLVVTAIGALALWRVAAHYWFPAEAIARSAPDQPIDFTHTTHAGQLDIDCTFCHRTAKTGEAARAPSVEQCMFCHQEVKGVQEPAVSEIARLREAAERGEPINWVRVHRLPDHVQFTHSFHVRRLPEALGLPEDAGVAATCSVCHGKVWEMDRVRQVRSLKMGDCVDCHRRLDAPTDCVVCHY